MIITIYDAASAEEQVVILLMRFKNTQVYDDPNNFISNWSNSSSHCSWNGITCSRAGHVTSLNLTNAGLVGKLHLPTLTTLTTLQHILLHGNYFTKGNNFSVSSYCNLQSLDFSKNNFSGMFPFLDLVPCHNLSYLNLSQNLITGTDITEKTGFGASLLQLDLSRNQISETTLLSYTIRNCQNLIFANFSDNRISGQLNETETETLVSCKKLTTFDISYNLLYGEIPHGFVGDSVKLLDLSYNNFSGVFSRFDFSHCRSLVSLSLSHNALSGTEFPSSLINCQVLETLDLSYNELNSLVVLDISENNLSGELPLTFGNCSSLESLNLTKNHLFGDFLSSVVSKLSSLRYLYVPFNNITGIVPLSLANCTQLQVLDLSSNAFTGSIPSVFCFRNAANSPSALEKILLAGNYLSGEIPAELGSCKNLRTIDFSFNNLNGSIPLQIWSLPNLSDMIIWANNLTGEIPEGICGHGRGNLENLILNNNFISGSIPQSIGNCTNMIWLSLTNNHITGEIPASVGNLNQLAILQLGQNLLTGRIPPELGKCRSLVWLDLSSNKLIGTIPSELSNQSGLTSSVSFAGRQFALLRNMHETSCSSAEQIVEFQGIRAERLEGYLIVQHSCPSIRIYTGSTPNTFSKNGSMIYLDLSNNSLSGSIPQNIGSLTYLQVLNLGQNELTGNIPDSFGDLKMIGLLYLSHNKLQGSIPSSLGRLSFLTALDVSNNNLTGSIPYEGQFPSFPSSSYENNSGLCGIPLSPCATQNHSPDFMTDPEKKETSETGLFMLSVWFYISMVLGFIIAFWGVVLSLLVKDSWRHNYFRLLNNIADWVYVRAALLKARMR
ncbi:hypothetical protein TanjilG_25679 [Lupinus angustifolius]|uniref:non-specific serine/threonine protein kinase n=1 Tax=Lupinus angustifolius TaxID=3871 RepID=A0A1J7HLQ3_LUPAN|nr:hypothetical protein TanjilG_25679 [Lupinus angustifolius]